MFSSLTFIVASFQLQTTSITYAQKVCCVPRRTQAELMEKAQGGDCVPRDQIEKPSYGGPTHQDSPSNSQVPPEPERPRSRCCPYDFDSSRCQVVNDRLLCGYNRNVGRPNLNSAAVHLSGGCRLRGGRLECGYEHAPFTPIRRPPGWDNDHNNDDDGFHPNESGESEENERIKMQAFVKTMITKSPTKKYPTKAVTKCVEINDRLVCKIVEILTKK